ncbi:unnamed protein product [Vitrella brassicaformis CCMP3155]|uniref:Glutamine cyclotransferase n=1 Tax=Vitrella brassicaformis (strain CCMP3155) TaxID=1169540 RepID=A0A0G4GZP9_VITBC|nr:unnamed protein product [Vitrella brassicaformis CCMP3155]|eukprot:CEM36649.1 unnamed protein product [Vitrella brassicaformis CCMP3155]
MQSLLPVMTRQRKSSRQSSTDLPAASSPDPTAAAFWTKPKLYVAVGAAAAVLTATAVTLLVVFLQHRDEEVDDGSVRFYSYEVLQRIPHVHSVPPSGDAVSGVRPFTQGLFFLNESVVVESGGWYGESIIRKWSFPSGDTLAHHDLSPDLFGEGTVRFNDSILQLTWREGLLLAYDVDSLTPTQQYALPFVGWGLATDGERLWATTGDSFLRTITLQEQRGDVPAQVHVTNRTKIVCLGRTVSRVNELEYWEGRIWGNAFGETYVLEIDPHTGQCTSMVSLKGLYDPATSAYVTTHDLGNDVLNGIAHHTSLGPQRMLVTGKRWPFLWVIKLKPVRPSEPISRWSDIRTKLKGFL